MCLYAVDFHACGHLSQTYRNIKQCYQKETGCRMDPNHTILPEAWISQFLSLDKFGQSQLPRGLLFPDPRNNSSLTIEINSETGCPQCEPTKYARYMEREEGYYLKVARRQEADAAVKCAEIFGKRLLEDLGEMIYEGTVRGFLVEVEAEEAETALECKTGGPKKHVRFRRAPSSVATRLSSTRRRRSTVAR
jgi:hypothetical protein